MPNLLSTIYSKPNFIRFLFSCSAETKSRPNHRKARTPCSAIPVAASCSTNKPWHRAGQTQPSKSCSQREQTEHSESECEVKPWVQASVKQCAHQCPLAPTLSSSRLLELSCWVMMSLPESSLMHSSRRDDTSPNTVAFSLW